MKSFRFLLLVSLSLIECVLDPNVVVSRCPRFAITYRLGYLSCHSSNWTSCLVLFFLGLAPSVVFGFFVWFFHVYFNRLLIPHTVYTSLFTFILSSMRYFGQKYKEERDDNIVTSMGYFNLVINIKRDDNTIQIMKPSVHLLSVMDAINCSKYELILCMKASAPIIITYCK